MTDITNTHLEAALIDQNAAGTFAGKDYAFFPVCWRTGFILGVAVRNEHGYNPIPGKKFTTREDAKEWADGLNSHIGLSDDAATDIIISSMRKGGCR
jgi:hypothetical protein